MVLKTNIKKDTYISLFNKKKVDDSDYINTNTIKVTLDTIEYYDSELKNKIETIINKNQNIRQSILEYANEDKKYISYHLIRDYEKGKTKRNKVKDKISRVAGTY